MVSGPAIAIQDSDLASALGFNLDAPPNANDVMVRTACRAPCYQGMRQLVQQQRHKKRHTRNNCGIPHYRPLHSGIKA